MDPGSSSLDPLPEGIPSNAMTPEQKEGRLADEDCGDGQDHGDANIQWHKLSFKELTWVQLYLWLFPCRWHGEVGVEGCKVGQNFF